MTHYSGMSVPRERLCSSLRVDGSHERAPDERLREAIHGSASGDMDCFVASLLAMTKDVYD
jgi:hypothetical protein